MGKGQVNTNVSRSQRRRENKIKYKRANIDAGREQKIRQLLDTEKKKAQDLKAEIESTNAKLVSLSNRSTSETKRDFLRAHLDKLNKQLTYKKQLVCDKEKNLQQLM